MSVHPQVESQTLRLGQMSTVQVDTDCLHELFEAQADKRPSHPALIYSDGQLSYAELDAKANQLARFLQEQGVMAGDLVGIFFERSEKPIIAILAILKAGAGYVPIDPSYPAERAKHILEQAEIAVLLTERKLLGNAKAFFDGITIGVDAQADEIEAESAARLPAAETGACATNLSYVLFTSGTTGRPKGIMTEHHSVVEFVAAFNEVCQIKPADRIYQGFSLGFDGSVEEIWMAFSNGATLVVSTPEATRNGDEVMRIFSEHRVTVFSTVPTFLSLITKEIPTVRLIIVSGEACPPELVRTWYRPNRRILNVYGPTETTVNTTAAECVPEQPVTIGKPLRGYETYILNEEMQPVPQGEPGELYIGGTTLARGYFKQPELTEKTFISNPLRTNGESPRLYKTGDLVFLGDDGNLHFMGRIDGQVKIRGFRIELSEIESVIREHAEVFQVVVNVYEHDGLKELAAYIVPRGDASTFDRDGVLQLLRDRVPPYMVPSYLDLLPKMPMLASGKADRKQLPKPVQPLVASRKTVVAPRNDVERKIVAMWEKLFKINPISVEDDFFMDLGGYSLLAAQVVTELRQEHDYEIALRDIYSHPTGAQLAKEIESRREVANAVEQTEEQPARRTSREVFESLSRVTRWTVVAMQGLSLLLGVAVSSYAALLPVLLTIGLFTEIVTLQFYIIATSVFIFVSQPAMAILSILAKWILIGRFKPGEHPVWGLYYFRWWVVSRLQEMAGMSRFTGSPVVNLYYRLMGAKVGRNTVIDTVTCCAYDLVSIGEDSSVGSHSHLLGYRVEDGMLKFGRIDIGSRCFVGMQCCMGLNVRMEDDTYLDDLSLLADGTVMKSGEARQGSPAQPATVVLPRIPEGPKKRRHRFLFGVLHFLASELVGELTLFAMAPMVMIVLAAYQYGGVSWALASIVPAIPASMVLFALLIAAMKTIILPRTNPGVYRVESWFYLRKWAADTLLETANQILYPVFTTIYLRTWLRMLGAQIGKNAEIAVCQMSPDMVIIGDGSFFADGSMVGGTRFFRGYCQLEMNQIGQRSFVGNNAVLPVGANLGNNCLLGVTSLPPIVEHTTTPDGSEWLGSPSFRLPYRKTVEGFDVCETFEPTFRLYVLRYIIDAGRILLPAYMMVGATLAFAAAIIASLYYLPFSFVFAVAPAAALVITLGMLLSVAILKGLLMDTFKPVIKPLWCVYVWLNELVNGAYETVGAMLAEPAMGTPYFNAYLRLMGCKVGKHAFVETSLFSEFDMVEIGDYAALNREAIVQNHLFEDRIMKSSYCKIGNECSVGNMAVVLYDAEMKPGSWIGPLSLLMKGETVPATSRSIGIPTRQLKDARNGSHGA